MQVSGGQGFSGKMNVQRRARYVQDNFEKEFSSRDLKPENVKMYYETTIIKIMYRNVKSL